MSLDPGVFVVQIINLNAEKTGAGMIIRRALPAEAETCWNIRNQAIRYGCKESYSSAVIEAWTPEKMPEQYRQEILNNPFFVAIVKNEQVVATGYLDLNTRSVEAIFTLPQYTGMGFAGMIIDEIKNEARNKGFEKITLSSTPNARRFYEKHGFTFVQERMHLSVSAKAELRCIDMLFEL